MAEVVTSKRLDRNIGGHDNLATAVVFLCRVAEILDDLRVRYLLPDSAHDARMSLQTTTVRDRNREPSVLETIKKLIKGKDCSMLHLMLFWKDLGVDNNLIHSYTLYLWEQRYSFTAVVVKAHFKTSLYQLDYKRFEPRQVRLAPNYRRTKYAYQHSSLREIYPDNRRNASRMLLRIREFLQFLNRYRVRELVDEEESDHQVEADSSVDENFRECEMDILLAQKVVATKPRIGALPFVKVSGWSGKFNFLGGRYHVWLSWFDELSDYVSRGTEYPGESFFHQTCFELFFLVDEGLKLSYFRGLWAENRPRLKKRLVKAHLDTALLQHDLREDNPHQRFIAVDYWDYEWAYERSYTTDTFPDNRRNASRILLRMAEFLIFLNQYRVIDPTKEPADDDEELESGEERDYSIHNMFHGLLQDCQNAREEVVTMPMIGAVPFVTVPNRKSRWYFLGGDYPVWYRWMDVMDRWLSNAAGNKQESFFHQTYFEIESMMDRGLLQSYKTKLLEAMVS